MLQPATAKDILSFGTTYLSELQSTYTIYYKERSYLSDRIKIINRKIKNFIEQLDAGSFNIFYCSDVTEQINKMNALKNGFEFLVMTLAKLNKYSFLRRTNKVLNDSIETYKEFIDKLNEYIEIFNLIKSKENVSVDEESDDYNNKMEEVSDYILSKNQIVTGNSLREIIGV